MALDIIFRTDNPPLWSTAGHRLSGTEVDTNFYNIKLAVEALQSDRPQPDNITSITAQGLSWIVSLESGTDITVPVQVLQWRWRGLWQPSTGYQAFDGFTVEGKGLYSVMIDHTSATLFDENLQIGGEPVYNKIVATADTSQSVVYDIVIYYPGVLADLATDVPLYQERCLRAFTLRASSALHTVYLDEAPSVSAQNMTIYSSATPVGTITVAVGQNIGTVTFSDDIDYVKNDMLSISKPDTDDPTAAGLSIGFAAERNA